VSAPGYDAGSRLWLENNVEADVPETPTPDQVAEAKALLAELVCDFPFVDDGAKANGLALLLLPYVRPLITGPTPLHLIKRRPPAPARPGTGDGAVHEADLPGAATRG
jgi:hypothetical protein